LGCLALKLIQYVTSTHTEFEFQEIRQSNARLESTLLSTIRDSGASIQKEIAKLSCVSTYRSVEQKENFKSTWSSRNENGVSRMALALTEAVRQNRSNLLNTMLLDSIYFVQIQERRSNIREAHHSTFEWVFRPSSESGGRWTNLVQWLRGTEGGQNVYWVTGKAGSGKSTLMRYLYEAHQTKGHLKVWAGDSNLLTACCFFWNPGNAIQKSLNGLPRTLLHELLAESPDCIKLVAPWRWRSLELGAKFQEPWTDSELLNVLDGFFQHNITDTRICVFVDGLDEFYGTDETREDLIILLKNLARNDNAKICLSSRPWNIFEDAFGHGPMLRLEDLTHRDIQHYVDDKLTQHCRFQVLKRCYNAECMSLIDCIVAKASGVFPWVYLVVRSLTQGLRDEDGLADLMRRLELIPADLELYFDQMLSTIDPFYLPRSSQLFQLTLCTDHRLSQLTLSFIHEDNPDALIKLLRKDRKATVRDTYKSTSRRVNALSKGLIEVNRTDSTNPYFFYGVDFLHRTVRDFLGMDEVRQKLEVYSGGAIPCHSQLCTAVLAQMQSLGQNFEPATVAEPFLRLLDEFLLYARAMEMEGSRLPEQFFVKLTKHLDLFGSSNVLKDSYRHSQDVQALDLKLNLEMFTSEHWADVATEDKNDDMSFFISTGLFHPVKSLIENNPNAIRRKGGRPLLDYALRRDRYAVVKIKEPNVRAARLLLERGADPNQMYGERTIWHGFLSFMRNNKQHIVTSPGLWTQAIELMIEHEAEEFPTVAVFLREIFDAETAKRLNKMLAQRDSEPDKQQPSVETAQDIFSGIRHISTWGR
jgi:NACHT domain